MTTTQKNTNTLIKFLFEGAPVRGAATQLNSAWLEMVANRDYPQPVLKLLGEFAAGAILLSSTIKFDGTLAIQVKGSGPVSMLIVEVVNACMLRGMAKIQGDIQDDMDLQSLINQDGRGQCAVILDPKDRRAGVQPYQGIVPLQGATVAENLETYMRQSEQLETRLWLAANENAIGGLLLQKMPSMGGNGTAAADPDAWQRLVQLASTVKPTELLQLKGSEILHRLFWQEKIKAVGSTDLIYKCNCSKEKIDAMLRSLGRQELEDILKKEGKVEIKCEFCGNTLTYTPEQIKALFS